MKVAALFPGQGFQKFGILGGLARQHPAIVRPLFAEADEALPTLQLSRLLEGTGAEIDVTPTEIAQPLMLATGFIAHRIWEQELRPPDADIVFGLGHSLGEYTALTAAGLLPFRDALALALARGEAMRDAGRLDAREQGMLLVNKPRSYAAEKWPALVANSAAAINADISLYNSPSLVAASGTYPDLNTFADLIREATGEKRLVTKRLPVSSAFHSRLMAPAKSTLAELVGRAPWQPFDAASFAVVSNVTARPFASIEDVKQGLVEGLMSPVRWSESVQFVDPHIDEFVALGAPIGSLMKAFVQAKTATVQ